MINLADYGAVCKPNLSWAGRFFHLLSETQHNYHLLLSRIICIGLHLALPDLPFIFLSVRMLSERDKTVDMILVCAAG